MSSAKIRRKFLPFIAPTRLLIDLRKSRLATKAAKASAIFNWIFFWLTYAFVVIAIVGAVISVNNRYIYYIIFMLIIISISRINEIIFAYIFDALDRLENIEPELSGLESVHRVYFLGVSYLELAAHFSILAYLTQAARHIAKHEAYNRPLTSIFDALYFSIMTITTTGYGDISPVFWGSKLISMYESLSGIVLFVLALGVYLSSKSPASHP